MRKRNPRLDNAVAEAIADLLATEFNDPRLRMVSVAEVQVSQRSTPPARGSSSC